MNISSDVWITAIFSNVFSQSPVSPHLYFKPIATEKNHHKLTLWTHSCLKMSVVSLNERRWFQQLDQPLRISTSELEQAV